MNVLIYKIGIFFFILFYNVILSQEQIYTSRKGLKFFPSHLEIVVTVSNETIKYELFNHWYSNSYVQLREVVVPLDSLTKFNKENETIKIKFEKNKIKIVDKKYKVSKKMKHTALCTSLDVMRKISYAYEISKAYKNIGHFVLYTTFDLKLSETDFKIKVDENLKEILERDNSRNRLLLNNKL
ncbi:hypothetical protein [Flavobacterium sp. J27]|uniref:hypothetical protein n=1 Tax=Flavobacterium sp. J27 TaxID=2060419 RepID=UPI0010322FA8|nr:hypothetical protein [Flavobacterium sp. J27]